MWLTKLLFILTTTLGVALGIAVIVAPWAQYLTLDDALLAKGLHLIANDKIVRRTAIACSAGLLVTAWVFFRSSSAAREIEPESEIPFINVEPESEQRRKPPPGSVAGA